MCMPCASAAGGGGMGTGIKLPSSSTLTTSEESAE